MKEKIMKTSDIEIMTKAIKDLTLHNFKTTEELRLYYKKMYNLSDKKSYYIIKQALYFWN